METWYINARDNYDNEIAINMDNIVYVQKSITGDATFITTGGQAINTKTKYENIIDRL